MGALSLWHWGIVLVIILLLFGRGRISSVMGELGKGLGNFRREITRQGGSKPPGDQN